MVGAEHEPEWPDKAMFAGILLIVAGAVGALFSLLLLADPDVLGDDAWVLFQYYPAWLSLILCTGTMVGGIVGAKHHTKGAIYPAIAAGLFSMGMVGFVPLMSLVALGFIIKAHIEGEDTRRDTPAPDAGDWPDKAMAASMLLFVIGAATLLQALQVMAGKFSPVLGEGSGFAVAQAVLALVCIAAAWQIYHLRWAWFGFVAVGAGVFGLGFVVLGPALAIAALVLLVLAEREQEFTA